MSDDSEQLHLTAPWGPRVGRIAAGVAGLAVAVIVLGGLGRYGIWDPWELSAADLAQRLANGEAIDVSRPPLGTWLTAQGFSLFGRHEWAGRAMIGLSGLIAVILAYLTTARFAGRRAGVAAAIVAGTSPLFLFNARQMLGLAPAFAASAAVFFCAMSAVFHPGSLRTPARRRVAYQLGWLGGLGISAALATMASGALLGVAPPLLAVGATIVARGEVKPPFAERGRAGAAAGVLALALVAGLGTAWAIWADYDGFSYWTGGVPRGGDPPTWEIAIERVFHSFAPWSALLPVALAAMLSGAPQTRGSLLRFPEENALRIGVVAWVAFGFLAQTLFSARYGTTTFIPVVAAAIAVGLFLEDVARARSAFWGSAALVFLFVGLIVRDYRAYPDGPVSGIPVEGIEVPEALATQSIKVWAVLLVLFVLGTALTLATDPAGEHGTLRRDAKWIRERWAEGGASRAKLLYGVLRLGVPVELIEKQWQRGVGHRIWLVIIAALLPMVFVIFGLLSVIAEAWMMNSFGSSLPVRIGRVALFLPLVAIGLIALTRGALFGLAKAGAWRIIVVLGLGLAVGGYTAFGFQPALSRHFSPREVYDTYQELAAADEPLGEFRVGGRAAAYYVQDRELVELSSQAELLQFLQRDGRVWAAFRADDLASVNRAYRRATGEHLFVADARSARMILATNRRVEGRRNENYMAGVVLDEPPANMDRRVNIDFDGRITLLGYDLELPHDTFVGPGEEFTLTWYFQVHAAVPGSYRPFVHIDGSGQRLNGDHDPVDGRYPLRLWEPGDVVVDRHTVRVPANYGRGNLTIFMGFYSGDNRLEVVEGPADEVDRARVGVLPIR